MKGLEPVVVGFSIRLLKKMEDDGVNLAQVEPIDPTLPSYCFKHEISFATIIQSGYEAFSLEKEHGVPVKMLQAHIARAKKTRDDLLDESQKRPRIMQDEQSEYETIKGK